MRLGHPCVTRNRLSFALFVVGNLTALAACGDLGQADGQYDESETLGGAAASDQGQSSAALGAHCASLCNNRRLASEAVCDEFYDPNGLPAHNSACISFVFDEYLDCIDHCGLQPVQNLNFSGVLEGFELDAQDLVVP